ncbi:MAG: nucleotidyltransferase family protein [Bacteroidota bacterium]
MVKQKNIGIIILAAGSSSRLGHPKQLVEIEGIPLLRRMAAVAVSAKCESVVVVLGAYAEKIKPVVENLAINILINKNWETGMGSSVASGMKFLTKNHPALEAAVLLVCDQYHLTEEIILKLIAAFRKTGKDIVASKYGETVGVPALFSKKKFAELINLKGKSGAKKIISNKKSQIELITFEEGSFDLDVEQDLLGIKKMAS